MIKKKTKIEKVTSRYIIKPPSLGGFFYLLVRLILKKIFFISFFFCVSLFSQVVESKSVSIEYGKEYFPLDKNIKLVFESSVGEMVKTIEEKDGLYIVTNKAHNFKYVQTLKEDEEGIYLVKTEQNVNILLIFSKHAEVLYSEPALQIQQPFKIGDTWTWKGYQVKTEEDTTALTITGRALSEEVLNLPAGEFKTLKVEIVVENAEGNKTIFTQWLAKGIGSVKMNVKIDGHGIIQFAMNLLGYDEINSELKEIQYLD